MHFCGHCNYKSDRMHNLKVHQRNKHKTLNEEVEEGSPTEKMIHNCTHCDYKSNRKWSVLRHQSREHKMVKEEIEEYPLPEQNEEQPTNRDLMEDSVQVFKIYKLLQRMKNK